MNPKTCLIITSWQAPQSERPIAESLAFAGVGAARFDLVLCADGGLACARAEGLRVDAVLGDFDSLAPELAAELGVAAIRYPKEKDDTDTLLCVKHGLARGCERFVIVGGLGGAFSHTVANLQALSFLTDMECEAEIITPETRALMVDGIPVKAPRPGAPDPADLGRLQARREKGIRGRPGQLFSVFSYAERTSGVHIRGDAKYRLSDAVLTQSFPLGARNEFVAPGEGNAAAEGAGAAPGADAAQGAAAAPCEVRISCGFGRLLVIIEG